MNLKKKYFVVVIASIFLMSCNNKSNEAIKGSFTTIKGTYSHTYPYNDVNVKEVTLSKIVKGKKQEVATYKLKKDHKYGFTIPTNDTIEEFYVLTSDYHSIPIYVKNNQVFNIDMQGNTYIQTNIPDKENETLYNWERSNDTLAYYRESTNETLNVSYKDFFPFFKEHAPKMKEFHKQVNTPNKKFNELMHAFIDLKIEEEARHFMATGRTTQPPDGQYNKQITLGVYDQFADKQNFKTTKLLELPHGMSTLVMSMDDLVNSGKVKGGFSIEGLKTMTNSIENDTLKGLFIHHYTKTFKSPTQLNEFIKPYKNVIAIDKDVKAEIDTYLAKISVFEVGTPGYDFKFNDVNDKKVSFKSLKGKVVYIDAWAMWCAPCKAEIPALKQLEKDFHGKDIQFVSISFDKPKELAKWKKFVKDEGLGGIQLFADNAFESDIATSYKINTIPRFLLFDKEGNIIDANATRPSDPKTKEILSKLLK